MDNKPELKKLSSQNSKPAATLGFRDGFDFSFGFWAGTILIFTIVIPALACVGFVILSLNGTLGR